MDEAREGFNPVGRGGRGERVSRAVMGGEGRSFKLDARVVAG